ncbi:MAG TPA: glycosyltransferase family 39 protein [Pyrinomonadaceae bacterium]|nr:glycosyltransferase family 39 protein [Pyrinomonadaceae bacterium]
MKQRDKKRKIKKIRTPDAEDIHTTDDFDEGIYDPEDGDSSKERRVTDSRQRANPLWLAGCFAVAAVAVFLRFYDLLLKPLHHDEGVNGFFLTTLFREGIYKYDPSNYHGPTLYYIALFFTKVLGLETFSIRASVGVFGVLMVALAFFLRKYLGTVGSLTAALCIALSPGMVYISRYFIHEIFFVFCSFGIVVGVLFFIEGRRPGIWATAWMALLLLICFLPPALNIVALFRLQNETAVWVLRAGFFLVEAILVFLVMRMLLEWNGGRAIYLLLASASTALFFATKETAFITLGTVLIACACIWIREAIASAAVAGKKLTGLYLTAEILTGLGLLLIYYLFPDKIRDFSEDVNEKFSIGNSSLISALIYLILFVAPFIIIKLIYLLDTFRKSYDLSAPSKFIEPTLKTFRERLGGGADLLLLIVAVITIFVYVSVLFFSSFFTYSEGVAGAIKAYAFWTKTGTGDHTQNGNLAYLRWLWTIESPILFLSAVGILIAFVKARHRFAMFAGLWAFGLFLAYTIIPYKTPWLALSFILPMCLIAGYGVNEMFASRDRAMKGIAALLLATSVGILTYQAWDVNFNRYDDDTVPYVYAHTRRGFLDLLRQVEYYAEKSGKGKDATIEVVSPDYWSMPWYTRSYTRANYHGRIVDANTAEMIVAKKGDQDDEVVEKYSAHYKLAGEYPLRPGVDLFLLVRRDLAEIGAKEINSFTIKENNSVPAGGDGGQQTVPLIEDRR